MRLTNAIPAIAFACLLSTSVQAEEPVSPVVALAPESANKIEDHSCTAFYIGGDRLVTAGHCAMNGQADQKIFMQDGTRADVRTLVYASPMQGMGDFALFAAGSTNVEKMEPVTLDCSFEPEIGRELRIEGFPSDMGFWVTWARISRGLAPWSAWEQDVFGIQGAITYGSSGSPVFDQMSGKVVGILVGINPKGQTLAIVQPISAVCDALNLGEAVKVAAK